MVNNAGNNILVAYILIGRKGRASNILDTATRSKRFNLPAL